jgi:mono/diheme cytochrome c family protein
MLAPAISPSMKALTRSMKTLTIAISIALAALAADAASAQAPLSPDDVRAIERGKEIYKVKANCQFCHKWDASGDQGYGGNASSLRKTFLNEEQFAEVIRCGRPGTGMPYHDERAYTDKRCYNVTSAELGRIMPPIGEPLQRRDIEAVVKYLFTKAVGRGASTFEECVEFWGQDTRQCEPMKK